MRKSLVLLSLLGLSGQLLAHPGHGHPGQHGFSLLHYLSEPEHVAGLALVMALIGGIGGWWWKRKSKSRSQHID